MIRPSLHLAKGLLAQRRDNQDHRRWTGEVDRVYLYHVRKTGGTSITNAFLSLGGEDPEDVERRTAGGPPRYAVTGGRVVVAHDRLATLTGNYAYAWSHIPAWRLRHSPRTFTVTVLRDPVKRVISLFRYLSDPNSDAGHLFKASAAERQLARHGFRHFLDSAPRTELMNQLHMFSKRLDAAEAADRIARCSLCFLTEDMAYGMSKLSDATGTELTASVERRSTVPFEADESDVLRLRGMLEPEYDLLARVRPLLAVGPDR